MTAWPRDTTAAKNAFYGNFQSKGWYDANVVKLIPPFRMYYDRHPMSGIMVHKLIVPPLLAAFNEIFDKCGHDQGKVDKTGVSQFGGCFNPRPIRGSSSWSNHSWACAIDLAPDTNGFGAKTTLPQFVIDAFKKQGARWGGDYRGRKDPMHFEFVSPA